MEFARNVGFVCSLSALTAISTPKGIVVNEMFLLGYSFFLGLLIEIIQIIKHNLEASQNKGWLALVCGRIQDTLIMLVKLYYGQVFL